MIGQACFSGMYRRWADQHGFTTEVLDYLDGDEAGIKSVTVQINGENVYGYLKVGTGGSPSGAYFAV